MAAMSKKEKIIQAKGRLLEKFKRAAPVAVGGRDRLPPGQHLTSGFPVLDLGVHPPFDPATWRFRVEGEVENPLELSWDEFTGLPRVTQISDFHCVTTWSKFDVTWGGVPFGKMLELVKPSSRATHLIQLCGDGYSTNLPLAELTGEDILLAYQLEGEPLPLEHGGPLRLIVPHLYAWKSSKFLTGLVFQQGDQPGFWEERGYHNRGDPWKEERYG